MQVRQALDARNDDRGEIAGEVAATAAVMAIKQGIPPKALKWPSRYFKD